MTTEEVVEKLQPWLARHRRSAWKPVVKDSDGRATASKFSGIPWIGPGADWPDCGHCRQPLQFFLQLNLGDLPEELGQQYGKGLLQLFYCTRDECQGYGGWEPFGVDLSRVRVIQPIDLTANPPAAAGEQPGPAKQIVGWQRFVDMPLPEEHRELGLNYTYDHKAHTVAVDCKELGLVFSDLPSQSLAEQIAISKSGDKLAGWPAWVQGVEYLKCPRCGRRMVYVFQVDSEDNIPFMFGDVGRGHITQCPEHKDVVAFGWVCG